MQKIKPAIFAAIAVSAFALSGCATKEFVNQQVSAEDARTQEGFTKQQASLDQHQQTLNQHQDQLAKLDQNTREAMERATAAGKLAEGKFLYEVVLSDDSVKFPLDSSKLSKEAQQRLDDFAAKLKADNRNVYLEIQGHTDRTGNDNVNIQLGEKRAEAVRLFMNEHGVPLNRMATISYGEKDPVADNKTRTGRAQNRRVVLVVMS